MSDLFSQNKKVINYSSEDIIVLEGLEPVRKRPGMYIGGTDEKALHHLVIEVLDNAIDEAVAGYANLIEVEQISNNTIKISDNGRGIPVDPHPKYPNKSALEVIMTTLHSGGKFTDKNYKTSGGLHGVGVSVVNALSSELIVEVSRDRKLYSQTYSKGIAQNTLSSDGKIYKKTGTSIQFTPDYSIFPKDSSFKPEIVIEMAKTKAYLTKGIEIRWKCNTELSKQLSIEETLTFKFPNGILDYLNDLTNNKSILTSEPFLGSVKFEDNSIEWIINWLAPGEDSILSNMFFSDKLIFHHTNFR